MTIIIGSLDLTLSQLLREPYIYPFPLNQIMIVQLKFSGLLLLQAN